MLYGCLSFRKRLKHQKQSIIMKWKIRTIIHWIIYSLWKFFIRIFIIRWVLKSEKCWFIMHLLTLCVSQFTASSLPSSSFYIPWTMISTTTLWKTFQKWIMSAIFLHFLVNLLGIFLWFLNVESFYVHFESKFQLEEKFQISYIFWASFLEWENIYIITFFSWEKSLLSLLSSSHSGGFSFVCVYKILCAVPQQLKKKKTKLFFILPQCIENLRVLSSKQ